MWWYSCLAGACCWCGGGGVVVCGGGTLPTITGIFNPALSATLRRVVPGGALSVPPYLSLTLRIAQVLRIAHITWEPYQVNKGVGWWRFGGAGGLVVECGWCFLGGWFLFGVGCWWFGGWWRNLLWGWRLFVRIVVFVRVVR